MSKQAVLASFAASFNPLVDLNVFLVSTRIWTRSSANPASQPQIFFPSRVRLNDFESTPNDRLELLVTV